jgi:hypothetical protein
MITSSFWWPLDLTTREEAAVRAFHIRMVSTPPRLDRHRLASAADLLASLMARHVGAIIDRDGLPHLCHVVNGWGNGTYRGLHMTDRMGAFAQRGESGCPFVLQCDPEGDFHPWQSFAYAVMAGVSAGDSLGSDGLTFRKLAKTSRTLNTPDNHELGHLLFALAYLDPDPEGTPFRLSDRFLTPSRVVDAAIDAHHYGSFQVCRKFHLTEGIAAATALIPGMDRHRATAQGFVTGQLDILFVLGAMLAEVRAACEARTELRSDGILAAFRHSLIIGDFFENHSYYAGHLIELACFAAIQGYMVTAAQRAAMVFIINEINATLPHVAEQLSFTDCFLHFGHYRRAITLFGELEGVGWRGAEVGPDCLGRYTVDFDAVTIAASAKEAGNPLARALDLGLYRLELPSANPRPRFLEVVACYERLALPELKPRGAFDHFRRVGPPHWPRAFHYELLDYGDHVGVEIHLESDAVLPMAPLVRGLAPVVVQALGAVAVEWDPAWWKSRGRLRAVYPDHVPPEDVADGLTALIRATFQTLDPIAAALSVSAGMGSEVAALSATGLLPG